ncbi:lysine-sensitive aspartokinase 3 [Candidatus Woesearchaeota archaeon]|nr:lysine-sensitive aspartokinase 3 [Candidatus Woesearchaeota archaeon]
MLVMKFGGSSVGSAERIRNVCSIVRSRLAESPVVVVSALQGITDSLIDAAKKAAKGNGYEKVFQKIVDTHQAALQELGLSRELVEPLLKELQKKMEIIVKLRQTNVELMDEVQSFGERMSARIVAGELSRQGVPSKAFDAFEIGMVTNPNYGEAEPLPDTEEKINESLKKIKVVPVITGFIGKDSAGHITTLGRGGSDYTAAIIGASVGAKAIEIWTDVNGVMTTDPKIVPEAKTIETLSFEEASELAYFGAKVLHPKTILPAVQKNIPVRVLNSFEPQDRGTTITKRGELTRKVVKAIACKKHVIIISVSSTRMLAAHGFLSRLFAVFEEYRKSVDMLATSEVSVSLTVDDMDDVDNIEKDLKSIAEIEVKKNKSIVCVVGDGMKSTPGIGARVFSVMGKHKINVEMISQGASEINISFVVDDKDGENAVKALHKEFFG